MGVPSAVALLAMVMHLPMASSLLSERIVHSCGPFWLQPNSWMGLPLSVPPDRSSTQSPLSPVIGPSPTSHTNETDAETPARSVTVAVTLLAPTLVGTPEIIPVVESIDSPTGRPVAW